MLGEGKFSSRSRVCPSYSRSFGGCKPKRVFPLELDRNNFGGRGPFLRLRKGATNPFQTPPSAFPTCWGQVVGHTLDAKARKPLTSPFSPQRSTCHLLSLFIG